MSALVLEPATTAFVYGTLQLPEVLQRVLGRVPEMTSARLLEHRRGRITGEHYPAVIAAPGHHVDGYVLFGVSDAEWRLLDVYEGELYERKLVSITFDGNNADSGGIDGTTVGRANTYVLAAHAGARFDPTAWSLAEFVERHLADFLRELDA